jgi:hypothetical protein
LVAGKIANLNEGRPSETASIGAVSQEEAAKLLNVSRRSVQRGVAVLEKAIPELSENCNLFAVICSIPHQTNPCGETLDFTAQNNNFRTNHPTKTECNLLQ